MTDDGWLIQVGRYKGAYKTRWTFLNNNETQAALYYRGLNIGNGYKKRLIHIENDTRTVVARMIS